jgi:hypothetical protein
MVCGIVGKLIIGFVLMCAALIGSTTILRRANPLGVLDPRAAKMLSGSRSLPTLNRRCAECYPL